VVIWDKGSYELIELKKEKITFFLKGRKLKGTFTLMLLKGSRKGNEWLLIKKKDEYASAGWELETCLTSEKQSQLREQMPHVK